MWRKRPLNIAALTAPVSKEKTTIDIIKEFGNDLLKSFAAGMQEYLEPWRMLLEPSKILTPHQTRKKIAELKNQISALEKKETAEIDE